MVSPRVLQAFERTRTTAAAPLLAMGVSLLETLRRRRLHVFFDDRDGDWVNWQRHGVFVSPNIHTSDAARVDEEVRDLWGERYMPKAGDIVFDVGAGIGEDTLSFSRLVGDRGRVVAIEAVPRTFRCLQKLVTRNGLRNVTVLPYALSDRRGTVRISTSEDHLGNSIMGVGEGGSTEVAARSLDDVVAELGLGRIDLLKMNIEGAERLAIEGMTTSLPLVRHAVISCHDFLAKDLPAAERGHFETREAVTRFFTQHGFELHGRGDDPRPWVRDYVYASRPQGPKSSPT